MSGRVFFDTNVLVYAYSNDNQLKRQAALVLGTMPDRWLSTQVLIELVNVFSRKLKTSWPDIQLTLIELTNNHSIHHTTESTIAHATRLAQRYGFSWFDALIVAAALECGCDTLYSEDLSAGQLIEGSLRVVNPFGM
ncbi:PIN domain-containing protein [Hymenobacter sp. UV11]|uniref:PIN domain-containing protein n=1 Tax=Hymenobacter sp. UV11 TaxID=1849735 RepID=UPI00105E9F40|nr:PIN domain-containing protein [Hymenobacter sp. UV11]TDN40148.1 hypothetical protein A8B98_14730 [Hymenobacter sp. UV11]TFZ64830.1 PIN domain-containing protein [Hymenobacter sp. UV11]